MREASLIRSVRFRAAHHYGRADWSEARNRSGFGATAESHEHDWTLTVTVRGPLPETGMVTDLAALDRLLREEVVERFHGRDLNEVIPAVREGRMQPSTEALAAWLFRRLAPQVSGGARLVKVRVAESDDLAAEVEG